MIYIYIYIRSPYQFPLQSWTTSVGYKSIFLSAIYGAQRPMVSQASKFIVALFWTFVGSFCQSFMTSAFLNGNPNFIVDPNSIVTGSHTVHMTVDLGVLIL